MIAGDVGEGAGSEPDAIDAALLQAVARGFKRKMGDPILGQRRQDRVQLDRVRRRVLEDLRAARTHDADRAETCRLEPLPGPELPHEGGDRGLAVGAGDGNGRLRLEAEEARSDQREKPARIAVLDDRRGSGDGRPAFRHDDGCCAALKRVGDEARAVGLHPRKCGKQIAGLDLTAVGRKASNRYAGQGSGELHLRPDQLTQSHRPACAPKCGFLEKLKDLACPSLGGVF